jgi:hypothetical protein
MASKWTDIIGIDPDYTDGTPVDEWLAANRLNATVQVSDHVHIRYDDGGAYEVPCGCLCDNELEN